MHKPRISPDIGSTLVQAWRLLVTKPLPEPVRTWYWLESCEQTSVKLECKSYFFLSRNAFVSVVCKMNAIWDPAVWISSLGRHQCHWLRWIYHAAHVCACVTNDNIVTILHKSRFWVRIMNTCMKAIYIITILGHGPEGSTMHPHPHTSLQNYVHMDLQTYISLPA